MKKNIVAHCNCFFSNCHLISIGLAYIVVIGGISQLEQAVEAIVVDVISSFVRIGGNR